MFSKAHQAHIAQSGLMTSKDQQNSSLSLGLTFSSPNSYYKLTFGSLPLCWVLSGGR